MPLARYGVLAGAFNRFERDPPVNYGSFYHGLLYLNAPLPNQRTVAEWRCALDVKAPDGVVEYIKIALKREDVASILALDAGYHDLAHTPSSGALDYVRSAYISGPIGCASIFYGLLSAITGNPAQKVFIQNVGGSVLDALNAMLTNIRRIYVFGAPFDPLQPGNIGMHDVHMNQGDPLPAPGEANYSQKLGWYNSGAIWRDGGVLIEHNDDTVEGFFIKFLTQTMNTGDDGHPR